MKILFILALSSVALSSVALLATPPSSATPTQQTEVAPQNASGAILSSLEKKLAWPLTLTQRESIVSSYSDYLKTLDKDTLLKSLSQITTLSPEDTHDAIGKYLRP